VLFLHGAGGVPQWLPFLLFRVTSDADRIFGGPAMETPGFGIGLGFFLP
jgi:hypothetical protein